MKIRLLLFKLALMKYLVALFVLTLALQPVQLQACAMDAEEATSHHAMMDTPHKPDCCDAQPKDNPSECDMSMSCNFASLVPLVLHASAGPGLAPASRHFDTLTGNHYTGPPPQPLLRPPIA